MDRHVAYFQTFDEGTFGSVLRAMREKAKADEAQASVNREQQIAETVDFIAQIEW